MMHDYSFLISELAATPYQFNPCSYPDWKKTCHWPSASWPQYYLTSFLLRYFEWYYFVYSSQKVADARKAWSKPANQQMASSGCNILFALIGCLGCLWILHPSTHSKSLATSVWIFLSLSWRGARMPSGQLNAGGLCTPDISLYSTHESP